MLAAVHNRATVCK